MVGAETHGRAARRRRAGAGAHRRARGRSRRSRKRPRPAAAASGPRPAHTWRAAARPARRSATAILMTTPRQQLADELLRRFAAALRSGQLYSRSHPIIARNLELLDRRHPAAARTRSLHRHRHRRRRDHRRRRAGDQGRRARRADTAPEADLGRADHDRSRRRHREEIATLVDAVTTIEVKAGEDPPAFPALKHVRVGRVSVEDRVETDAADMATFRRLYNQAVIGGGNGLGKRQDRRDNRIRTPRGR